MKEFRKSRLCLLLICLLLLLPKIALAADTISVQIPNFTVTLNGVQVDQTHQGVSIFGVQQHYLFSHDLL